MTRTRNSALALVLLLAVSPACSKKEQTPPPEAPKKAQPAKPAQKPAAALQKPVSSATGPAGRLEFSKRTDPFKPLLQPAPPTPAAPAGAPPPRPAADLLPIQSFEVGKFRLVGIIAGLNRNKALVIDPNGKGYVVQEGMQIGSGNGRISRITASTLEVVEPYKDEKGRARKRTVVLTLAKKR